MYLKKVIQPKSDVNKRIIFFNLDGIRISHNHPRPTAGEIMAKMKFFKHYLMDRVTGKRFPKSSIVDLYKYSDLEAIAV